METETVVIKIYYYNPKTGDIIEYPKGEPYTVYAEKYYNKRSLNFFYLTPAGYILQTKRMILRTKTIKNRFHILG